MAYEGFLAVSAEGDLQSVKPVFIGPNSAELVTANEHTPKGIATFLIGCSIRDEMRVYIMRLRPENLRALVEDPDLVRSTVNILADVMPPLAKMSPRDPMARFPYKAQEGIHELVMRHVDRPVEFVVQAGTEIVDMALMN